MRGPLHRCWSVFLVLTFIIHAGCTSTPNPPPLIESIQRIPLRTISIDGHQIAYIEIGSGPPLILIHGLGGAMWNWEHQQFALSSHYRVITVDLLGSGMSAKPDITYSPSKLTTFFLQFMNALEIDKATLLGNSMGAGLAMATALTEPHRVQSLILISGFPQTLNGTIHSPLYQRFLEHRPPLWLAKIGNWLAGRWATKQVLEEILYDVALLTPLIVERSYQNRIQTDVLTPIYSLMEHMDEWEHHYGVRLQEILQPTLILWGEEDQVFQPAVGQHLHELIPQTTWHLIPKAGHLLQWEKPEQVNAYIQEFLQTHNHDTINHALPR
ncbi:MAG: putative hydrolase YugF [Nitrospirales bacterium]|nr:MAG: putative hydrolase YugF [Nitrospirales bacterium]